MTHNRPNMPLFVIDGRTVGFEMHDSSDLLDHLEFVIDDDVVRLVIVGTPATLTAIGLTMAAMTATEIVRDADR